MRPAVLSIYLPALLSAGSLVPTPAAQAISAAPPRPTGRAVPVVADTMTTKFVAAGIPVILRRVASNEVVTANVYLLGGVRQTTAETEGIEPFLLDVSERGTTHASRDALRQAIARLGTQIGVEPDVDWTAFRVQATVRTFDPTWAVMADRLMFPAIDSGGVEFVRQQYLSGVRQRRDSPDALVSELADSMAYQGTPYDRSISGTAQSIAGFTRAMLRRYATTQIVRSRILVVVVGNVTRAQVTHLVVSTIGRLPLGTYHWTIPPAPGPGTPELAEAQRSLPTNYILGYYHGPAANSPDYHALRVATAALEGELFGVIRSERHLSYAVEAPFVDHALTAGGFYVTTEFPDTTLALMRTEVKRLQTEDVNPRALDRLVQLFITQYFLDNETNADQANFLVRAQLYRGDYREADRFVDELRAVSPADVQRVARTYMRGVAFAYVGDTTKLSPAVVAGW